VKPSDLGGAKALPGEQGLDEEAAKARGTRLHLLLEHLSAYPSARWPELAQRILPQAVDREELLAEAAAVLTNPALTHIFAADALAEVAVTADLGAQRIYGIIDRLVVTPNKVLAVDFKSNAQVPDQAGNCPKGLLRQMAAYAHALAQIYPDREIETALLWTRTASLMVLPHDLVTDALKEVLEP
jgi:ATP-dependent helicase/nuclease subunit A